MCGLELSRNEEESLKSIFPELGTELDPSGRVNLKNSVLSESPKSITPGHLTVKTADIRNLNFVIATRAKNLNGLQRGTERDNRQGKKHHFETMSEATAYRNHIKNSKIKTREVFERETSSPQNILRTLTMNIVTRLDNNQLTRSTESSKHEEKYEPEVNPDPELSSSDSSETSSSDSIAKKNKSTKKKKRCEHRKYDSSDPSSSDDSDSYNDSHYRRKQRKNKKHRKQDPIKICAN